MVSKSKKAAKGDDGRTDFVASDHDIPSDPSNLEVGLDLIYRELTEPYLTSDQRAEFKAICRHALKPEYREDAKAQLLRLYPRTSVIDTEMCKQIADAVIFLVQAAAALETGETKTAQTFMAQASNILPALTRRRISQRNKHTVQNECILRFAKRLLKMRPEGGWESIDQAACAGQPALQALLKKYKETYGLLWKIDAGTLIIRWLEQQQPDVYNAYLGVSASPPAG